MKLVHKLSTGVAGSALALTLAFTPVGAAHSTVTEFDVTSNGAASLVSVVAQATDVIDVTDSNIDIAVVELNNSLNNLRALNNVLNNSPVLSGNDIIDDVTVQDVSVLSENDIEILEDANINIDDVVGVAVLSGGDFLVFTN